MAHEGKSSEAVIISDPVNMCESISSFYLNKKFSDVTLVLDGQQIHAHKVILAARSKYFESLLGPAPPYAEVVIRDVSSEAFRKLLKYIYTGSVTLSASKMELIFDVLHLASRYHLKSLETAVSEKISSWIDADNVFDILNKANDREIEALRSLCHDFMDENPMKILSNDKLNSLTQKSMVKLLERDSFLAPEIEIFKSVAKWSASHKDHDHLVVQCVRLSALTNEEITSIVYPSNLIEHQKLRTLMAENEKQKSSKPRVNLVKDENLATSRHGAEVISGQNTSFLLNGNRDVNKCAYHLMNDKDGITVKLGIPSMVNHIRMRLLDTEMRFYNYYVEVSLDQRKWRKVLDYDRFDCRSHQNLYFDQVTVRYVRIVGTGFVNKGFHLVSFEIYLTANTPTIDGDGVIYPTENVATTDKGAVLVEGHCQEDFLSSTDVFASCGSTSGAIVVQLAQPYILSTIRFLLPTDNKFKYKYCIETSIDRSRWQTTVDYHDHSYASWQYVEFQERPVVYIKLTGNGANSSYNGLYWYGQAKTVAFCCASLQCPSSCSEKSNDPGRVADHKFY